MVGKQHLLAQFDIACIDGPTGGIKGATPPILSCYSVNPEIFSHHSVFSYHSVLCTTSIVFIDKVQDFYNKKFLDVTTTKVENGRNFLIQASEGSNILQNPTRPNNNLLNSSLIVG